MGKSGLPFKVVLPVLIEPSTSSYVGRSTFVRMGGVMPRIYRHGLAPSLRLRGGRAPAPCHTFTVRLCCRARPFAPLLLGVLASGWAVFASTPAHAVCDNHDPTTGQTATCNTSAPNPDTTRVQAMPGSTNVTVNVLP